MAEEICFLLLSIMSLFGKTTSMTTPETTTPYPTTTMTTCIYNNVTYQPYEYFSIDFCYDGIFVEDCTMYTEESGHCCFYNNTLYKIGEKISLEDGCNTATCREFGEIGPDVPCCEYEYKLYKPGKNFSLDSCNTATCYDNGEMELEVICCSYEGVMYKPGEYVYYNACGYLECTNSGYLMYGCVMCPQYCDELTDAQRSCCSCNPRQCEYKGKYYNPNETVYFDSCNSATCDIRGEFAPNMPCCEYEGKLYKYKSTFQVGACKSGYCGNFEIIWTITCCEYAGTTYELNYEFFIDACNTGYCTEGGEVEYYDFPCPSPVCEYEEYVDDVCCPMCIDSSISLPDCEYKGQFYKAGPFYPEPCKSCFCSVIDYDYRHPTATVTCGNITCQDT